VRLSTDCIRYIHIALWVRKVVLNKLNGRFHFKRPVGSLCIVPEEVLHQPDVELLMARVSGHELLLVFCSFWPFFVPRPSRCREEGATSCGAGPGAAWIVGSVPPHFHGPF